jgi:DNA-binding beta-propeller fold protein YncE
MATGSITLHVAGLNLSSFSPGLAYSADSGSSWRSLAGAGLALPPSLQSLAGATLSLAKLSGQGGPVLISGMDPVNHGGYGTPTSVMSSSLCAVPQDSWVYVQVAMKFTHDAASRGSRNSVAVLGTTASDWVLNKATCTASSNLADDRYCGIAGYILDATGGAASATAACQNSFTASYWSTFYDALPGSTASPLWDLTCLNTCQYYDVATGLIPQGSAYSQAECQPMPAFPARGNGTLASFFSKLAWGDISPRMLFITEARGNLAMTATDMAVLQSYEALIAEFINSGGGLVANTQYIEGGDGGFQFLAALAPKLVVKNLPENPALMAADGGNINPQLTAAGASNFPSLTNGNIAGMWHQYFTGDPGSLEVLAIANVTLGSTPTSFTVLVGGSSISIPSSTVNQSIACSAMALQLDYSATPNITLACNASSFLPVQYSSLTPGVCSTDQVFCLPVTPLPAGSSALCQLVAEQQGDGVYAPAAPVLLSFSISGPTATASASPSPSASRVPCAAPAGSFCAGGSSSVQPCPAGSFCPGLGLSMPCYPATACPVANLSAQLPCIWNVSTVASVSGPYHVAAGPGDMVFAASLGSSQVIGISSVTQALSVVGPSASPAFFGPQDVAVNASGHVFVADNGNHLIRLVSPGGAVTTLAGALSLASWADGAGPAARFNTPKGLGLSSSGSVLYIADTFNHRVRALSTLSLAVSTVAGSSTAGAGNGVGSAAQFNQPYGLAAAPDGASVYVADSGNNLLRQIALPSLAVSSVGSGLNNPTGVFITRTGQVFVADQNNHRLVVLSGSSFLRIAGSGLSGYADGYGSSAAFRNPTGIAMDGSDRLFVADYLNNKVRSVSCVPCPASFFCASGAPVPCPAGSACPLGSVNATLCPKGSSSPPGASSCSLCPAGSFSSSSGASSCQPCPPGHFCPAGTSSWARLNCGKGSFCPQGSAAPTPCPQVLPPGGWGLQQVQGPAFLVETARCLGQCFFNESAGGSSLLSVC